jgi:hypothetical protein
VERASSGAWTDPHRYTGGFQGLLRDTGRVITDRVILEWRPSAAGSVGEKREKPGLAALGHFAAPPVTGERAGDSYGAGQRHAPAKVMVGSFVTGRAVR